ncbi:hypothetical protein [Rufibacter immobilis]|uniref:hypothetical protein n=1 Tax=Rufibacter immobilis TaxID=1348778 RepID=UPI0035E658C6
MMKKLILPSLIFIVTTLATIPSVQAQVAKFKSPKVSVVEPGTNKILHFHGDNSITNGENTIEFSEALVIVKLNDKKLRSQTLVLHPTGKFYETKNGWEIETKESTLIKVDGATNEINFYFEDKWITMTFYNITWIQ